LPGATNATLTLTNVQSADAGNYDVVVCGPYGCVTSAAAGLLWVDLFYFTSSPQSWVGQGQTLTFTDVVANVALYPAGCPYVALSAGGYGLDIVKSECTVPTVGYYANATRWLFGAGAGMWFTGAGRGDNTLTGSFNVLQAVYDDTGQIASFAVDFLHGSH